MTLFEKLSLGLGALSLLLSLVVLVKQFVIEGRVAEVHVLFNSRMTELMQAEKSKSRLEGRAERDAEGKK